MNKRMTVIAFATGLTLAIVGVAVHYFWATPTPVKVADRLCDFVRDEQKMTCVAVLASDKLMRPGVIIDYHPDPNRNDSAPLPNADLFGHACYVPGTASEALNRDFEPANSISIPTLSYDIDRSLKVGADLGLPQLVGAKVTAGPKWSEVSKLEFAVDEAWMALLDENEALNAIRSCEVRKSCVDRIISQKYSVIGATIVAKGVAIKVYSQNGDLISINGGLTSGIVNIDAGTQSNSTTTASATLRSDELRVVGVRFFPANIFDNQPICTDDVVFRATGQANAKISGGGGNGHIELSTSDSVFGKPAELRNAGGERSECRDDFERTTSESIAFAHVAPFTESSLSFQYEVLAKGGHYVTAATCAFGQPVGITGHDTTAEAAVDLSGTIYATVRTEKPAPIAVNYEAVPKGTFLRVVNWKGELLPDAKGNPVQMEGGVPVDGTGTLEFLAGGEGVYRVETTMRSVKSADGIVGIAKETANATISVLVQ